MPLKDIASGGELSRLMLAMKTLEAGHTGVDCMIFDEIDTGISGKMAQTVAEKMIAISRHHQVICVSHLPQLAAAGDRQYLVSKHTDGSRTVTDVRELSREGRIDEIARMISGAEGITGESDVYAAKMIAAAEIGGLLAQGQSLLLFALQHPHLVVHGGAQLQTGMMLLQPAEIRLLLAAEAVGVDRLHVEAVAQQQPCQAQGPGMQGVVDGHRQLADLPPGVG